MFGKEREKYTLAQVTYEFEINEKYQNQICNGIATRSQRKSKHYSSISQ